MFCHHHTRDNTQERSCNNTGCDAYHSVINETLDIYRDFNRALKFYDPIEKFDYETSMGFKDDVCFSYGLINRLKIANAKFLRCMEDYRPIPSDKYDGMFRIQGCKHVYDDEFYTLVYDDITLIESILHMIKDIYDLENSGIHKCAYWSPSDGVKKEYDDLRITIKYSYYNLLNLITLNKSLDLSA